MLQEKIRQALINLLAEEFKSDWPKEFKKIDLQWLAEWLRLKNYAPSLETLSDARNNVTERVIKEWAIKVADKGLGKGEEIIAEKLVRMIDPPTPEKPLADIVAEAALSAIGKLKQEFATTWDTIDAERANLTKRVNEAESKVSGFNGSVDWLRQKLSENLKELDKIREDAKLRGEQLNELASNLTAAINSLTIVQKENSILTEHVRNLQKKTWPRGVPAAYRVPGDGAPKKSARKTSAK